MIDDRPRPAEVERTPRPMRIAFVYCRNPLPMRRADQITVAHLLEFLHSRGHVVDVFCFDGDAQGQSDGRMSLDDITWLSERCENVVHVRQSRMRAVSGAIAAVATRKPMQVGWLTSRRLAAALSEALATRDYDVLYAYYFRSAETVVKAIRRTPTNRKHVPTILAMQLSQSLNTARIRDNATNFATRLVFGLESRLVARYEARIWRKFDRVALIGSADVAAIAECCRIERLPEIDNWFYSPHGTDIQRFRPRPDIAPSPRTVLFAGTLFYPPNIQAAVWFAKSIWPEIKLRVPDARLLIVGRDPAPEVSALGSQSESIEVVGSVPDLAEYMLRAAVCVNPVRAAGGMQNKLIEYLASGRPVVATGIANEGIKAPGDLLRIADTESDFADEVVSLLLNPEDSEEMGRRAHQYAWAEWSWEAHFLRLEANMEKLVQGERRLGSI